MFSKVIGETTQNNISLAESFNQQILFRKSKLKSEMNWKRIWQKLSECV